MSENVLPCPFCGSANVDPDGWASQHTSGPACDDCGASAGGAMQSREENVAAWNTRPESTERTAREAAEAAVARMREGVAEMVGVMKREAQRRKAAGQHEAAAMLEDRANELRALLEGGA